MDGRGSPVLFSPVLFFDHQDHLLASSGSARRIAEEPESFAAVACLAWTPPASKQLSDSMHAVARAGGLVWPAISHQCKNQWNPKYGCQRTVTTRFALIALVAWQY